MRRKLATREDSGRGRSGTATRPCRRTAAGTGRGSSAWKPPGRPGGIDLQRRAGGRLTPDERSVGTGTTPPDHPHHPHPAGLSDHPAWQAPPELPEAARQRGAPRCGRTTRGSRRNLTILTRHQQAPRRRTGTRPRHGAEPPGILTILTRPTETAHPARRHRQRPRAARQAEPATTPRPPPETTVPAGRRRGPADAHTDGARPREPAASTKRRGPRERPEAGHTARHRPPRRQHAPTTASQPLGQRNGRPRPAPPPTRPASPTETSRESRHTPQAAGRPHRAAVDTSGRHPVEAPPGQEAAAGAERHGPPERAAAGRRARPHRQRPRNRPAGTEPTGEPTTRTRRQAPSAQATTATHRVAGDRRRERDKTGADARDETPAGARSTGPAAGPGGPITPPPRRRRWPVDLGGHQARRHTCQAGPCPPELAEGRRRRPGRPQTTHSPRRAEPATQRPRQNLTILPSGTPRANRAGAQQGGPPASGPRPGPEAPAARVRRPWPTRRAAGPGCLARPGRGPPEPRKPAT